MSDNRSVYTTPLAEQTLSEAYNSILWRLAVAMRTAAPGDREITVVPDEILLEAERRLFE